jgi:hypothetical protein
VDGDLRVSRVWFEAAFEVGERAGDVEVMAEAVLGLGGLWVHEHRTAAAATVLVSRLQQMLAMVEPGSVLGLRLRARLAAESDYLGGGATAVLAVLQEARVAAGQVVQVEALSLAHHCLLGPGQGPQRRALATEMIGRSPGTGRRGNLLVGLLWHCVDLFLDGDRHAQRRLAELRDLLAQGEHRAVGFVLSAIEVMLTLRAGDFDQAEAQALACAERGAAAGDADVTGWYGGHLVAIRWYQGRLAELVPMLVKLVQSPTLSLTDSSFHAALAVAAASAGDRRTAAAALATVCGDDLADLPLSSTWLVTMNGVVEAAHLLGDADTSARAYRLLRPFADLPMMASLGVACFGSVQHALGVACLSTGDLDRAVEHLGAAVHRNLALAHWPAVMASRLRYAQALTRRARPGDAATAARELAAADEDATALGIEIPRERWHTPFDPAVTCVRQGRSWRVEWGHRTVMIMHSVGMLHLAVLTASPGQEIPACDLAVGVAALRDSTEAAAAAASDSVRPGVRASAQPILDREAARQYRNRLSQLRTQIEDLDLQDDGERADPLRGEYDWLSAELAGANGIGGRMRLIPDDPEKARIAVGKAIRRAVTRIAHADPQIGEHLRNHLHTGMRCAYRPSEPTWH